MKRVVVASLLAMAPTSAMADASGCRDAVESYNSAVDEISYNLRRYSSCVSLSEGNDDCSLEFRRLRHAQDAFESAVSAYGYEC